MKQLTTSRDISARRACRLIDQPWSTQQYKADPAIEQARSQLRAKVAQLAAKHEASGYRTVHAAMVTGGETVNHKTVLRIWQEDGHAKRKKPVKRKVPGVLRPAWPAPKSADKNDVWALDFVHDSTQDNRPFWALTGQLHTVSELLQRRASAQLTGRADARRVREETSLTCSAYGRTGECCMSTNNNSLSLWWSKGLGRVSTTRRDSMLPKSSW